MAWIFNGQHSWRVASPPVLLPPFAKEPLRWGSFETHTVGKSQTDSTSVTIDTLEDRSSIPPICKGASSSAEAHFKHTQWEKAKQTQPVFRCSIPTLCKGDPSCAEAHLKHTQWGKVKQIQPVRLSSIPTLWKVDSHPDSLPCPLPSTSAHKAFYIFDGILRSDILWSKAAKC